jgi:spore cortex biosynthesis protein YabQ
MSTTVAGEFLYLLFNLGVGVATGVLFDCYRIFHRSTQPGWFLTQLADLLFWVIAALLAFGSFYLVTGGELCFYTLLMIPSGMVAYLKYASPIVREWLYHMFVLIGRALVLLFAPIHFILILIKITLQLASGLCRLALLPLILFCRWLRREIKEGWRRFNNLLKRLY